MRPWRNWQTRKIKDLVVIETVEVRVLFAALLRLPADAGGFFYLSATPTVKQAVG